MARPPLGVVPLDSLVSVRLTSEEKTILQDDADVANISMSELIRRRYFGRPILADSDRVAIRELKRITGLLKHIHNSSGGAYSHDTAAALREVTQYVDKLANKK